MITDSSDWLEFCKICTDFNYRSTKFIRLNRKDVFLVVISGEITARLLSISTQKSEIARIFTAGHLIPLFQNNLHCDDDGSLTYEDTKLFFTASRGNDSHCSAASFQRDALIRFLNSNNRSRLALLSSLMKFDAADLMSNSIVTSDIQSKQVRY